MLIVTHFGTLLTFSTPHSRTHSAAVYSSIAETAAMDLPEGYYASPKSMQDEMVIALYDYEAQGDQELNLKEGDCGSSIRDAYC